MRPVIIAILVCLLILVPAGCTKTTVVNSVTLGNKFQLGIGQTAVFTDTDLKIKFVEVIGDSRCPSDVTCILIGEIQCLLEVTYNNSTRNVTIEESGDSTEAFQQIGDYTFFFNVLPYPVSTQKIKLSEYQLYLKVTKSNIQTTLGSQFTLAPKQSASIGIEDFKIEFITITEDSRCPSGVTCIWAGQVTGQVEFTLKNTKYEMELTESGISNEYSEGTYENYNLNFRIEPYPQSGKTINQSDYRLILLITK